MLIVISLHLRTLRTKGKGTLLHFTAGVLQAATIGVDFVIQLFRAFQTW